MRQSGLVCSKGKGCYFSGLVGFFLAGFFLAALPSECCTGLMPLDDPACRILRSASSNFIGASVKGLPAFPAGLGECGFMESREVVGQLSESPLSLPSHPCPFLSAKRVLCTVQC